MTTNQKRVALFVLPVLLLLLAYLVYPKKEEGSAALSHAPELTWQQLAELDVPSGEAPPSLQSYDGKLVRIAGFAVPLEDSLLFVRSFLLVPNAMACIHVPPPPPNQIVQVTLKKSVGIRDLWGPLWVTGNIAIHQVTSQYGSASYEMQGLHVETYR